MVRERKRKEKFDKPAKVIKPVKDPGLKVEKITPRSDNQAKYIDSFEHNAVTFGIGPAGTGKTFLACYMAAKLLAEGKVQRILLVRPVVEAGESLGFLPGGFEDKLAPYIQPLNDALVDMIGQAKAKQYMTNDIISVIPLAYMRGRTLNNSFVILDEAQNTTTKQMKMFLTRMGNKSRFVINGDITQTDLNEDVESGLNDAIKRLKTCNGVNFIEFNKNDIVRHKVVQQIVEAYEND